MENNFPKCTCSHHKFFPILVVILGLELLLHAMGYVSDGNNALAWPAIILVMGLIKLFGQNCKCCGRP